MKYNFDMGPQFRKKVFLSVLVFSIIVIGIVSSIANKEREQFRLDRITFEEAGTLLNEGKLSEAEQLYKGLLTKYPDSGIVLWRYALCLFFQGNFPAADFFLNMAVKTEPSLSIRSLFIFHLGLVAFRMHNYPKAAFCFLNSIPYGVTTGN